MAKVFGSSIDERVGLMILSHARGKNHKLQSFFQFWHACMHTSVTSGTRQIYWFFINLNRVPGLYPHSPTAEATMLIRTFNVHVNRFICAHSKSPWILKFSPWNVLECPWILFWQNPTNPVLWVFVVMRLLVLDAISRNVFFSFQHSSVPPHFSCF